MSKEHIKRKTKNRADLLGSMKDQIHTPDNFDSMYTQEIETLFYQNDTTYETIRLFLDAEFTDAESLGLISIGIVSDQGHELYLERTDFDKNSCPELVANVVLPKLIGGKYAMTEAEIKSKLTNWLLVFLDSYEEVKIFIDYYPNLLILDRLLKAFPKKPKLNCMMVDLNHLKNHVNVEERKSLEHNALWDAKDIYARWKLAESGTVLENT